MSLRHIGALALSVFIVTPSVFAAEKVADGLATGTLTVDGKTIKLAYAIARTAPDPFEPKKNDVVVLLTNEKVGNEMLLERAKLYDAVLSGSLRGLKLTIGVDQKPSGLEVLDPKGGVQISGGVPGDLATTDFSEQHVAGKFSTTGPEKFSADHEFAYDVTFAVPVQAIKRATELTVDASTGTALPPGGGDPGKAYTAFDKAVRAGNVIELKKYALKDRPMWDVSAAEQKELIDLMKAERPETMKITSGYVAGDHATLTVADASKAKTKTTGTIEMAREEGAWKVLIEKWHM